MNNYFKTYKIYEGESYDPGKIVEIYSCWSSHKVHFSLWTDEAMWIAIPGFKDTVYIGNLT